MLNDALANIDALGDLKQGWNSYGAPPISTETREKAKTILTRIMTWPISAAPTPSGSVLLIWHGPNGEDFCLDVDAPDDGGGFDCTGMLDML